MKKEPHKTPIGATVKSMSGRFTILGITTAATTTAGKKDRFYICRYESDGNTIYNRDQMLVQERDIDFLYKKTKI